MAEIVLGLGTSHGPMLVTETRLWQTRLPADHAAIHSWQGRRWSFDELVAARAGERFEQQITPAALDARQARNQAALDRLADLFAEARPDVAVIVGNDQMEIFDERLIPAFGVFYGETIENSPMPAERIARLPPGIAESVPGYIPPGGAVFPGHPELARAIIARAMADGFDVAAMGALPKPETPHAFGFVFRRIMRDRPVPTVPVLINTFYPPNQPGVRRCHAFGQSLIAAIRDWPSTARVVVIASGGLSHFVVDEEVDRLFLEALREGSVERLAALGESWFQDGTSELKNWIPVAGGLHALAFTPEVIDYVPCYRSAAGTGNAMGFVAWHPATGTPT